MVLLSWGKLSIAGLLLHLHPVFRFFSDRDLHRGVANSGKFSIFTTNKKIRGDDASG